MQSLLMIGWDTDVDAAEVFSGVTDINDATWAIIF